MNEIVRYIDPKDILDHLQEGKVLRVRIHGPYRQWIQVAVCPRDEMHRGEPINDETGLVIDLEKSFWASLAAAANESNWIPPDYFMNDWVADLRDYLLYGGTINYPDETEQTAEPDVR